MANKIFNQFKGKGQALSSGSTISITEGLQSKVGIGLNWSGIPKKGMFNKMLKLYDPVDLDGAVAAYKGTILDEVVSYKNMLSSNGSMRHSGDDRLGDLEGNDGLDNESIIIDLEKLHKSVNSIYVYLKSVKRHDFSDIPYSILRIFEIIPESRSTRIFATFNLSTTSNFKGKYAMLMGKFERQEVGWTFTAMGESLPDADLHEIGKYIAESMIKD